ncbi:MAG: hypothetical protein IT167_02445 [Bryobacterales bacterium]|nr:hypothetical protein [Bryobacterales bacterium]
MVEAAFREDYGVLASGESITRDSFHERAGYGWQKDYGLLILCLPAFDKA